MRKVGLGALLVIMALPVMAVDGYKDLKFGMTPKEVRKAKVCQFGEMDKDDNQIQMMSCPDFKFSGGKTAGHTLFIDDKLVRVAIELKDENQFISVLKGLNEKYGAPSMPMSKEAFKAVTTMPNQTADVGFDDNTVFLRLMSSADNEQSYILMYNTSKFNELLDESSAKANRDDL